MLSKKFTYYSFLIIYSISFSANSQNLYPINFLQFSNTYAFDNPAAGSLHEKIELKVLNSFYTGLLKNVGLYYADASFKLENKNQWSHHVAFVFHSEYETELLNRNRGYLRYALQIPIQNKLKFSAGINGGFYNYAISSTLSSSGRSMFAPDAAIGLWLKNKNYNIGISSNQIFESTLESSSRKYYLGRYFTLMADYKYNFSPHSNVVFALKAFKGNNYFTGFETNLTYNIVKNFAIGALYYNQHAVGAHASINQIAISNIYSDFSFTYYQPMFKLNNLSSNRMEIQLKIYMKRSQD